MPIGPRGTLGIGKEATWAAVQVATKYLSMISENITENIEQILSAAHRGIVDEPLSLAGLKTVTGDIVVEVHPANFGDILRSAIDAPTGPVAVGAVVNELCDCEDAWVGHAEIISTRDVDDKKKGTYSVKLLVPDGVAAGTILATREVAVNPTEIDMTSDDEIKLWIKSSINMIKADLKFIISETAACANGTQKEEEIEILVAGEWLEVTIPISTMGDFDKVISVGVKLINGKDEFTLWLDDIRRVDTDAAVADAKRYIFIPRQDDFQIDCPLCSYTLELFRDTAANKTFQYRGAVVNTLALNFSTTDKILKATCGIIAKSAHVNINKETGISFPTTPPFVWDNAVILTGPGDHSVADSGINEIESFSISLDNHLVGIASLDGNDIVKRIYRDAAREINISFIIDFVDQAQYDFFAAQDERAFQIKFSGARVTDADATPYSLQIDMPLVRYTVYPPYNISGSGRLTAAVVAKAKFERHASMEYAIKFTLINTVGSYN